MSYNSWFDKGRPLRSILACALLVAGLLATSACGGGSGSNGAVNSPSLSSLSIAPANPSIGVGQHQQFTAEGTFSDGSKRDLTGVVGWTSSNTAATINASGMATGAVQGDTVIGAASGSVKTSTNLTVGPPKLSSIAVVPSNALVNIGAPVQLTATGTFSDGGVQDLTKSAIWSSSNTGVATVSATGLVTGVAAGGLTIAATYNSTTGSDVVTVAVSTGLPTGIGWHALASNTVLQASGACPSNNFGGDPFMFAERCGEVIRSWSGAIADTTANRLVIWGGGAGNYFGNEIYALSMSANPVTLTRLKDPTVPTNFGDASNCVESIPPGTSDFAPNSRSSYGGMAFVPDADSMYILNGSLACLQSSGSISTWTISLKNLSNSTSWVHEDSTLTGPKPGIFPNLGGSSFGDVADYDPNSGLVFISDTAAIFTYNEQTNTYTRISPVGDFVTSIYLSGAIDPARKLFVLVGGCPGGTCGPGNGVFVADISNPTSTTQQNWTAGTIADPNCAEFLSGGVNPLNASNPGIVFDSVASDFVGWPNQGNSIYILTPDPANQRLTCQKQTFTGGPPNSAHTAAGANSSTGTFGRFRYFPGLDVFVLVNDWDIPAYVLRLR